MERPSRGNIGGSRTVVDRAAHADGDRADRAGGGCERGWVDGYPMAQEVGRVERVPEMVVVRCRAVLAVGDG